MAQLYGFGRVVYTAYSKLQNCSLHVSGGSFLAVRFILVSGHSMSFESVRKIVLSYCIFTIVYTI